MFADTSRTAECVEEQNHDIIGIKDYSSRYRYLIALSETSL
jgi:hypothetical protein